MECGRLGKSGHRLIDLNVGLQGMALFERIRRCSPVGGSISLEVGFEV